jgi:hypothetical protein
VAIERPSRDALQGSDSVSDEEASGSEADEIENQPPTVQPDDKPPKSLGM